MTFTIGTLTRCAGQNHIHIPVTLQSGKSGTIETTPAELQGDPPDTIDEARERVLDRVRSAAKEANAINWTQLKTALDNKTFKV